MLPFLLEIGTEELPPSFQLPAVTELSRRVAGLFSEHELATGESEFFYTPRRLAVRVSSVAEEKPAQEVELQGPPKKAAFDAQGKPTRTALGFARAHGQDPSALYVKLAGKGEYVFVRKTAPPVKTADVLMNELPGLLALPSPRAGRWQDDKTRFPRPVRWLLCLLGDEVIPFEFGGLVAGNTTFGHRNFTPGPIVVPNPATYEEVLLRHKVVSSPAQRRAMVESALKARAAEVNGVPLGDSDLLEETVNITEHPEPILCSFSPDYLSLPAPLLITALKMHQRCFSVSSPAGVLLSHFIAVANTPGCDHAQVRMWYEKAVDSRLRDARFFYEADLKLGLEPLVEEEKKVVWIEEMGTLYDKTQRLRRLCAHLTSAVPGTDAQALDRAALLCKTDLLTQVVREKEFTSLQGIMGGIYAERAGEPPSVAAAISEHYLPRSPDDDLPRTLPGALLSIADKTDNIVATFLTGNVPTGSEDPFALRRQATGLLTIILELKLPVDVQKLTETAARLFPGADAGLEARLDDFFRERMAALLADRGIIYDIANAVLAVAWHTPAETLARAQALTAFRARPEFEKLVIGQKRVANILKGVTTEGLPEADLFAEDAEKELWSKTCEVEGMVDSALAHGKYQEACGMLLQLREHIDRLFDEVMVMAEDAKLRDNRLRLLACVRSLFRKVADLSLIVLEGETGA